MPIPESGEYFASGDDQLNNFFNKHQSWEDFVFSSEGSSAYKRYGSYTSYAGCDIKVLVMIDKTKYNPEGWYGYTAEDTVTDSGGVVLAEISTLSISSFRSKNPVRAFGKSNPTGFVRGGRVISGSMIFSVFNKHPLHQLVYGGVPAHESYDANESYENILIDQLPAFDIVITFSNEFGNISRMAIYGVEIMSEGQVMSIQDLMIENSVTYQARFLDPMQSVFDIREMVNGDVGQGGSADYLFEELEFATTFEERTRIASQINSMFHSSLRNKAMSYGTTMGDMLRRNPKTQELLIQAQNPFR